MEENSIMNNKLYKILSISLVNLFLCTLTSCEDDPLLAPQTETESDGGSYGLLIINEGDDVDESKVNPEIF